MVIAYEGVTHHTELWITILGVGNQSPRNLNVFGGEVFLRNSERSFGKRFVYFIDQILHGQIEYVDKPGIDALLFFSIYGEPDAAQDRLVGFDRRRRAGIRGLRDINRLCFRQNL
jgi:hypothetical protein